MSTNYKMTIVFNAAGLGVATNVFWFQDTGGSPPIDSIVLDLAQDWAEDMWEPISGLMADTFKLKEGIVDEVDALGVKIRNVGSVAPSIDGNSPGDPLALTTAGSSFVRTSTPRVQGRKRWAGFTDGTAIGGLFINAMLSALATATLEWLAGPGTVLISSFVAGVISERIGDFVPFADSGVATNIPGTQVTRKPLRGQ